MVYIYIYIYIYIGYTYIGYIYILLLRGCGDNFATCHLSADLGKKVAPTKSPSRKLIFIFLSLGGDESDR